MWRRWGKVARAQRVSPAGAKAAYKRAVQEAMLKYLYAMGWIGGMRNRGQCGLTLIGQDAARRRAKTEILGNRKLPRASNAASW